MCNYKEKRSSRKAFSLLMSLVVVFVMALAAVPTKTVEAAGSVTFGSKKTAFETGKTYTVPIALKHAYQNQDSAAAACPGKYGTLSIGSDGTATLTMNLRSVTVGTITDYAYDFYVYQGNLSASTKAVDVIATQEVAWNNSTKTVPETISFTIPSAMQESDYVYLTMMVDAMGYSPDARLAIDYENAKLTGDASLNYTKTGSAQVDQFGKYTVNAEVKVVEGRISDVTITGDNFGGDKVTENKSYLSLASEGMVQKIKGLYSNDDSVLNDLDAVSGATYSSNAIKEAVMNALGIVIETEEIPEAKLPDSISSLEAGQLYSVKIKDITDVVAHSVIGKNTNAAGKWDAQKATAYVRADETGALTLCYEFVSGTDAEPLEVLGFNGYYEDGVLKKDGVKIMTGTDGDYTVVTKIEMPLGNVSSLQQTYKTNVYLYVDAMKNLNGEVSGIVFDNGKFNIDSVITVYWDTLKKYSGEYTFTGEPLPSDTEEEKKTDTEKKTSTEKQQNTAAAEKKQLKKGAKYTVGGSTYQALSSDTVSLVKAANKKSVSVPATVTVGGVKATVTAIGNSAFASAKKKVTSVTIGANVTSIGKKAFANCKKLKKITVKSKKLKSVGAKALSGIHKKAVIKVPKKQKKAYKKLFKNKGQKKTVKIK